MHWLLQTPSAFYKSFHNISSFPKDEYSVLELRLWFFVGNKLQLLKPRHTEALHILPLNSCNPATPRHFIELYSDADGETRATANISLTRSIRDLVLDMIEPGIASGTWKNVQFLDFGHPEPLVLQRFENRALTISIHLSLEQKVEPPVGKVVILQPDGSDGGMEWNITGKRYCHREALRFNEYGEKNQDALHRLGHDLSLAYVDAVFQRSTDYEKGNLLEILGEEGAAKYVENVLSAILAARLKEGECVIKADAGYLAVRKKSRRVFVFLDQHTETAEIEKASIIRDEGQEYTVIGSFRARWLVSFSEPVDTAVLRDMIGDDGRLKISWRLRNPETEIVDREGKELGWEVV